MHVADHGDGILSQFMVRHHGIGRLAPRRFSYLNVSTLAPEETKSLTSSWRSMSIAGI
jgi:hypothetical protein